MACKIHETVSWMASDTSILLFMALFIVLEMSFSVILSGFLIATCLRSINMCIRWNIERHLQKNRFNNTKPGHIQSRIGDIEESSNGVCDEQR